MNVTKPIVFAAAALLSTAAFADDQSGQKGKSAQQKFEQLDQNQDRQISKSEAANDEMLSATFASVDADSDGQVSQREYTAHMSSEGQERSPQDRY